MSKEDEDLENLLLLDGERYVIDEMHGLWVKFEAKRVGLTKDRPHGVKYSLTLHDRTNERIMGFDNAHPIEFGGKKNVAPSRTFDHWHRDGKDEGRPYKYVNAGKLQEDFWSKVDDVLNKLERAKK
jgi:hypothetical protein